MKKIKLVMELEYDDQMMHGDDKEAVDWFYKDILQGDHLFLSDYGDISDILGKLKLIEVYK